MLQTIGAIRLLSHVEHKRLHRMTRAAFDPAKASGAVLDRQLANAEPLTKAEKNLSHRFDTENADPHAVGIEAQQLFRSLLGLEPCSAVSAGSQAGGLILVK